MATNKQTNKNNTTRHLKVLSECLSRDQKHDHVKIMASSTRSSIFAAIPCLCEDLGCISLFSSSPVRFSSLI